MKHLQMVHDGAPFDEEKVHDDAPIRDERVHNDAPFNQEKVHDGAIKGARPRTKRCTAVHPHNNLSLLPNQEDLEEREHASEELPTVQNTAVVSKPEPRPVSRPTRKSTPFPTDPAVLEQMAAVFMQAGLQPQAELAKMRDWHLGKDRRFVDWVARTREWIRKDDEFKERNRRNSKDSIDAIVRGAQRFMEREVNEF